MHLALLKDWIKMRRRDFSAKRNDGMRSYEKLRVRQRKVKHTTMTPMVILMETIMRME